MSSNCSSAFVFFKTCVTGVSVDDVVDLDSVEAVVVEVEEEGVVEVVEEEIAFRLLASSCEAGVDDDAVLDGTVGFDFPFRTSFPFTTF